MERGWGIAFALAGAIGFSFRPILIKLGYALPLEGGGQVSAATLLFLRMALSAPFFAAVAWWLRDATPRIARRDWAGIAALGFVGYYLASLLDFLGLQYVGAGLGRLILSLYPTMVVLLSALFLGTRPGLRQIAALAVSYAGIVLVVSDRIGQPEAGPMFALGVSLVFASGFAYAVYLVAGSALVQRVGSMRFTAWSMLVSTVPATAQFFLLEPLEALVLPSRMWAYALLLATVCTVLPVFLVAEALKRIGANHFALIGVAGPVFTVVAGAIGLDEPFTAIQFAGAALVLGGVLLVSMKPRHKEK